MAEISAEILSGRTLHFVNAQTILEREVTELRDRTPEPKGEHENHRVSITERIIVGVTRGLTLFAAGEMQHLDSLACVRTMVPSHEVAYVNFKLGMKWRNWESWES